MKSANTKVTSSQEKLTQACSLAGDATREIAESIKEKAKSKYAEQKDTASELTEKAETVVKEKPLVAIGCAFAAGWLVSKLLK